MASLTCPNCKQTTNHKSATHGEQSGLSCNVCGHFRPSRNSLFTEEDSTVSNENNGKSNNPKKSSTGSNIGKKIGEVRRTVNNANSAFKTITGQSVTPLDYARQKQEIHNQTNYQLLRIESAKLTQETRKADIEEKRIEIYDAQYKEVGHHVDTAWLKADIAEIDYQIASVDKDLRMVGKDIKEIELATQKDNKAIAIEKQELNYLKGLEDLRSLTLGLSEQTYENDTREGVLEVNGSEIHNNSLPSKNQIKAFLIG